MSKLERLTGKVFGNSATATGTDPEIGQFGSALAGTYVGTTDVAEIQALSAWDNGWIDAVAPNQQFPTLPEMTGVMKVFSHQYSYILQQGLPEYDGETTYYIGSWAKALNEDGVYTIYESITDNNLGNDVTDTTNWKEVALGGSSSEDGLNENQITNCILSADNPSITVTDYSQVSYVNIGCTVSDTSVSGFSSDNYLLLSEVMPSTAEFTLEIPFVLNSVSDIQTLIYINNGNNSISVNNGVIALNYDGYTLLGTTTLSTSTEYTVLLTKTSTEYTIQIKADDGDYGDAEITLVSDFIYYGGKSIYIGGGDSNYLQGTVDLSGLVITSGGSSYWDYETLSDIETVHISGTLDVLMPDYRNTDLTLNNVEDSITLNKTLLYTPVDSTKTILVKQDGELMIRSYYEESYDEPSDGETNGVWFDKSENVMKQLVSVAPNLIINGASLSGGIASDFSQSQYLELPESYTLGSSWSMSLAVNIEENADSDVNVIIGDMTESTDTTYPYSPDGVAVVYDGAETVTAYLRRDDVYIVQKEEDDDIVTGYVRKSGTLLVAEDVTVYSDADLTTEYATATGSDWVYSGDTAVSIIAALSTTVTEGTNTLALSYDGTTYTFNDSTFDSTDTIRDNINIYIGAAPSYTDGYFNSTIDIGSSVFSFWTWNKSSSTEESWSAFTGCVIGSTTDDGTNITSSGINYPVQLVKDVEFERALALKADTSLSNLTNEGTAACADYPMPSTTYVSLTVSSSGTVLTAPADGWVLLHMASTSSSCFIALNYSGMGYPTNYLGAYTRATASGQGTRVMLPVGKGDSFMVEYYSATLNYLIFVYAKGSESEA